jgi:hypothetical protein
MTAVAVLARSNVPISVSHLSHQRKEPTLMIGGRNGRPRKTIHGVRHPYCRHDTPRPWRGEERHPYEGQEAALTTPLDR